MAYKITTEYTDSSYISLEIIQIVKINIDSYLITTSTFNQYFVDRAELDAIKSSLSTALDKFKNL